MGVFRGVVQPVRGFLYLLRNRALWKYALLPVLLNIAVVATVSVVMILKFDAIHARTTSFITAPEPDSLPDQVLFAGAQLLQQAIGIALALGAVALLYILFLLLAGVIGAPFNERLAEQTERLYRGTLAQEPAQLTSIGAMLREGGGAMLEELRKIGYFLRTALLLALLNVIPGLGTAVYAAATFAFTAYFLALEFTDFAMSRRRLKFRQRRQLLATERGAALGFGAVLALTIVIPLVNLVMIPVAVVSGTLFYLDRLEAHAVNLE